MGLACILQKETVWGKNVGENLIDIDGEDKEL